MTASPSLYLWYQDLVFPPEKRRSYVERYLALCSGDKILDLGCGPATFLPYFGICPYVGIDMSEANIAKARRKYANRQHSFFVRASISDPSLPEILHETGFDLVVLHGVMHHLPDDEVRTALRHARTLLKPEGRLVTFDPARYPSAHPISRLLISLDRGRFVREESGYRRLVEESFAGAAAYRERGLLRVPYDLCVISANKE